MKRLLVMLILLLGWAAGFAQTRTVKGRVTDETGQPVSGVNVTVKSTKVATQTGNAGEYSIQVPQGSKEDLTFSAIGYATITLAATAEVLDAKIEKVVSSMEDVVVVGYQTMKRKELTGAVSSVSAKDIRDIPLNSAAEALTGRLAGVLVQSTEGSPGAEVTIKIRGGGSISGDNSPIYIVDGIQVENALSFLAPSEIESVDVLKDAASTAIYGARGANGVVIITTKGGREMKTRVSYDMFYGIRNIANKLDVMKPYDFVQYQYQIYNFNTDQETKNSFRDRYGRWEDLDIYKNMPFVDWQEEVFGRNAGTFTQSINVTGGTKATTFNLSVSNTSENGVMLESGFRRTMVSFKFDHKLSEKVRFGFNARYGDQRTQGAGTSNTGTQGNNRLRNSVRYKPFIGGSDIVDEFDPEYALLTNLTSPVLLAYAEERFNYRKDLLLNAYASYNPIKGLTIKSVAGFTPSNNKLTQFSSSITGVARQNAGMPVVTLGRGEAMAITNSNTIAYSKTIAKDHKLDLLAGQEIYQTRSSAMSATVKWLPVDITAKEAYAGIQKATPPAGAIQDPPTSSETVQRLLSFFGRANYSYQGKYLATFTFRRDGSTLFSPENRYGNFPSMALAWRASQEKFLEPFLDKAGITDMKVRFSIGTVGNNRIGTDLYKTMFNTNQSSYAFIEAVTPGFAPLSYANPNIKWETTISRNLGFDLTFLNNRLTASVDLYSNNTKDLLLEAVVPSTTGYTIQQQNIGKTQNRGIEVQLAGTIISNKNFTWSANLNLAANRNKIVDLGFDPSGQPKKAYTVSSGWITGSTWDFLVETGKPLGQFYGYVTDGYYKLEDFDYNATTQAYTLKAGIANNRTALGNREPQPGDLKFKKLSSKASMLIDEEDKTVIGNAQPKLIGGFNQQFTYKSFDLSLFMNWAIGGEVYNANRVEYTTQYLYRDNNMLAIMNDRWKWYNESGQLVKDPAQLAEMNKDTKFWTPSAGQYAPHSFAIEDGSFLRISNITLGYSLPDRLLRSTKFITRVRVYATVNNLHTFTKYTGFDPEANTRRNPLTPSVDYSAYPRSRFYVGGINVTF
ncbi:MAG: TonB-dependent receptor [Chitinophagaceae bacterium]